MKIINASIDVSKIDKSKIQSVDKDGNPFKNGAKYYSVSISIFDEADKYGNNVSIVQAQSKEEREGNVNKVYIGNGKVVFDKGGSNPAPQAQVQSQSSNAEEDLPF
jgi:hypothetical protein